VIPLLCKIHMSSCLLPEGPTTPDATWSRFKRLGKNAPGDKTLFTEWIQVDVALLPFAVLWDEEEEKAPKEPPKSPEVLGSRYVKK